MQKLRVNAMCWTPRYKDLVAWVNDPDNHIDMRFAATLLLYERMSSDMELGHRMARFWDRGSYWGW